MRIESRDDIIKERLRVLSTKCLDVEADTCQSVLSEIADHNIKMASLKIQLGNEVGLVRLVCR